MRILVCPLDWGLGHAARCVPLIRALRAAGHEVTAAATGGGLSLLRAEFPALPWIDFPGYRIRYARTAAGFLPVLLAQAPRVLLGLRAERRRLRRLLAERPCDLVISDGRYGLRAPGVPTILVTHQIAFRAPPGWPGGALVERLLLSWNLSLLRRFHRVWIPDWPGERSLAGALAGPAEPRDNREWIGPLGRFAPPPGEGIPAIDVAAVVSGPEPQRTLFEQALRPALEALPGTRVLVRGKPGRSGPGLDSLRAGGLTIYEHLPGAELARVLAGARTVVARSGYTTVMELAALGAAAAVLVPTPGQTEQEYLARHLAARGAAVRAAQSALDLTAAVEAARRLPGFRPWREADPDKRMADFVSAHPSLSAPAPMGKGPRQ